MASRRGGHGGHGGSSAHRYPRVSRVNQVVREVLAEELERRSDTDERLLLVTVTGVTVDPDLRHAVVYLSSMGQDAADALEEYRVALQAAVGRQTRLKRTPRLSFEVDPGVVHGAAVEDVLRRLQRPGEGE